MQKKPFFQFSSSLKKDVVLAYRISLILVIIVGGFFVKYSVDQKKKEIEEDVHSAGERIVEAISYNIDYLEYQINYAAKQIGNESIALNKVKIAAITSSFEGQIRNHQDLAITWNAFSWIDKKNKIIADGAFGILKKPIDISKRDYIKDVKVFPNKIIIGQPVDGAISGRFILPIARGVFSKQKEYLGALVFGLDVEKMLFKISDSISNDTFQFAVINDRNIAFNSTNFSQKNRNFIETKIDEIASESPNEILGRQSIFSADESFVGLHKIKNYPLKIVVFYDQKKSHEQIIDVLLKQSLQILLMALVCIVLFQRIYGQIVGPILDLSQLALKISNKDFAFNIKKPQGQELRGLYTTLNSVKEILIREGILKEQLEIANKQLRKANEAKAEFLAKSSHDIKNYIFGICGLSRLILGNKDQSKILGSEDLQMIETISEQSEELMDFVEDLLDTNQIESGNFTLEKIQDCEIGDLINRIVLLNKSFAIRNKIHLRTDIEDDLPKLRCDVRRMKQILVNLISNAVKYGLIGGVVIITAKYLKDEDQIYLEIADDGIGMEDEEIKMILEGRGKNIDKSSFRDVDSYGIGMPIVLRLVELHHGKIEIESKKNIGTKVKLFFNVHEKSLSKAKGFGVRNPNELEEKKLTKNKKILLVEDNPVNIKVMTRILRESGYQTRHVENGLEALKILDEENFDLILMDGEMPIMNGYEASRLIREGREFKNFKNYQNIPIITFTSSSEAKTIELAKNSGMNFCLEKSTSKTKLISVIEEWLS